MHINCCRTWAPLHCHLNNDILSISYGVVLLANESLVCGLLLRRCVQAFGACATVSRARAVDANVLMVACALKHRFQATESSRYGGRGEGGLAPLTPPGYATGYNALATFAHNILIVLYHWRCIPTVLSTDLAPTNHCSLQRDTV